MSCESHVTEMFSMLPQRECSVTVRLLPIDNGMMVARKKRRLDRER